jgi:hypothetical protein
MRHYRVTLHLPHARASSATTVSVASPRLAIKLIARMIRAYARQLGVSVFAVDYDVTEMVF